MSMQQTNFARDGYAGLPNDHTAGSEAHFAHTFGAYLKQTGRAFPARLNVKNGLVVADGRSWLLRPTPMGLSFVEVTRDGIEVKIGQVWRDLDRRVGKRECRVVAVGSDGKAALQNCACAWISPTLVAIRRMHKHSTGWSLVSGV